MSPTFKGLTPGDKMKKMGVVLLDSSKDFENSTLFLSVYLDPNFSSMKALRDSEQIFNYTNFFF